MSAERLRAQAERIRASQVLGRSDLIQRLFDFLVESSAAERAPKEIEIAIDVFGKDARFEVARDAMVRVYMHKLRRKLEEYYSREGSGETDRLIIPRGEYRLVLESPDPAATASGPDLNRPPVSIPPTDAPPAAAPSPSAWRKLLSVRALAAAAVVLLAANLMAIWATSGGRSALAREMNAVREHPLWHDIVSDDQPIYIAVGDYYIFGELDASAEASPESVRRLVREFNINSRGDLEQLLKEQPELDQRYMDLALRYLPIGTADAMHSIVPLLEPNNKNPRQVQVILASELTPAMIRSSHIIYMGLTSGMGILQDIAFAGSRFRFGETYDELVDRDSNQVYVSQSSVSVNDNTRYRDYGYFSTFAGPNGNRIVILAGTRDVALMHTAEAVSRDHSLSVLERQAGDARNFEALYAVDAIDRKNLDGQLLLANRLRMDRIWSGEAAPTLAEAASTAALIGTTNTPSPR